MLLPTKLFKNLVLIPVRIQLLDHIFIKNDVVLLHMAEVNT